MHAQLNDFGSLRRHRWALPFTCLMAGGAIASAIAGNRGHVTISLFLVLSSALPLLIERLWRVRLPVFIQTWYVAFLFISMFSGEVLGMYGRFYPWDDIVHFISGLFVGMSAILWLASVIEREKIQLSAWLHALYIFCLGAATAVIWEIIEFSSDHLFGTFLQRNDLFDTMSDLIEGSSGALIAAVVLYLALTQRYSFGVSRLIAQHRELNR